MMRWLAACYISLIPCARITSRLEAISGGIDTDSGTAGERRLMVVVKPGPAKQKPAATRQSIVPEPECRYSPVGGSSRAIDSALAGRARAGDARAYPRHARSLTARAVRQRVLVLGSVLLVASFALVIAVPKVVHRRSPPPPPALAPAPGPALALAAVVRNEAAVWVSRWVAPSTIVGCDPLMCSVLLKHDVHVGQLNPLSSTATDPLDSSIVVATQVLRSQMGGRLVTVYAPDVLASFGTGSARIDIRVVASDGSAAYERQLQADWQARKANGSQLLLNSEISVTDSAKRQIEAGDVDSRLLIILPVLVHFCGPVRILRFGGAGPGRSPGMPLLAAFIASAARPGVSVTAQSTGSAAAKMVAFLKAQWTFIRATSSVQRARSGGQTVVQLDVTAPPQLNAFNGDPATTTPITVPSK
jgi:hypothetical protein